MAATDFFNLGENAFVEVTLLDNSTPPVPVTPTSITVTVTDPAGSACTVSTPTPTAAGIYQAMVALLTVFGIYNVSWAITVSGAVRVWNYIFTVLATSPVASSADLGTFMGNANLDSSRAAFLLYSAQALCETVVAPLPAGASGVVLRMAAAAYTNPTGATTTAIGTARVEYKSGTAVGQVGVVLTSQDRRDILRFAGRGGAFSVDLTPADAATTLPFWDGHLPIVVSA